MRPKPSCLRRTILMIFFPEKIAIFVTFEGFSKRFEKENTVEVSSVARGRGRRGGLLPSPIGLATKMQNTKNISFLALLRESFALE